MIQISHRSSNFVAARCGGPTALTASLAVGLFAAAALTPLTAQPRIPTQAPPEAPSSVVVAGEDEPGEPMVVSGVVADAAGEPVAGASVFVYQAAADGVYGPHGNAEPRLKGYLRTDAQGRYRFRTVKPGSYPGTRIPAHIHIHVAPPGGGEEQVGEIVFEGDPFLSDRARLNPFFSVRTVESDEDGVLRIDHDIRLTE
jgi:protocatechuate 3,4-dioxygenase beta subunit